MHTVLIWKPRGAQPLYACVLPRFPTKACTVCGDVVLVEHVLCALWFLEAFVELGVSGMWSWKPLLSWERVTSVLRPVVLNACTPGSPWVSTLTCKVCAEGVHPHVWNLAAFLLQREVHPRVPPKCVLQHFAALCLFQGRCVSILWDASCCPVPLPRLRCFRTVRCVLLSYASSKAAVLPFQQGRLLFEQFVT